MFDAASEPSGSRLVTVTVLMLAIVTGLLASGLHVLAVPRHIHQLAPRGVMLPQRGGTTGGYLGLAQGSAVMVLGLMALLGRRLLGLEAPLHVAGFAVGILLILVGLTMAYRLSLLEAHVHPHVHDGVEHEHIHLHAAPQQIHDHDQTDIEMSNSVLNWSNLIGFVPALVLVEPEAVLYLVTYLAVSTLAMGALGSWLGRATRADEDGSEVLRSGVLIGYALAVAGLVWAVVFWPPL